MPVEVMRFKPPLEARHDQQFSFDPDSQDHFPPDEKTLLKEGCNPQSFAIGPNWWTINVKKDGEAVLVRRFTQAELDAYEEYYENIPVQLEPEEVLAEEAMFLSPGQAMVISHDTEYGVLVYGIVRNACTEDY